MIPAHDLVKQGVRASAGIWYLIRSCWTLLMLEMVYSSLFGQYHACWCPEGWINIKMPSYQYRKSHCGDKTILRPSYLHNGIPYTGKTTSLYWIGALAPYRASVGMVVTVMDRKQVAPWWIWSSSVEQDMIRNISTSLMIFKIIHHFKS